MEWSAKLGWNVQRRSKISKVAIIVEDGAPMFPKAFVEMALCLFNALIDRIFFYIQWDKHDILSVQRF